ncbi:MAG: PAS domain-containing sensor histidine kinase [Gammaproteobacteria bacterium]|nr:MAG: PAS domain-containing sensor histidine kinase [Gammaproteobacteria bacterium]RLA52749.1 MAG: PAS domain-containing sensor histidine kinase [Gammaproteobacteria bacterium]
MKDETTNQLVLDNLNTVVLLLSTDLHIIYLNPAAENLLAVSAQRLLGRNAADLFADSESRQKVFEEALQNDHSFTERKAKLLLPDLTEITVDYSATPLNINAEAGLLLELQPMDRTLRIDREEALISANDISRNLVRGLAHEIKNPLGGIRGASQLLAQELNRSELVEYTDVIIAETERLRELVDRLLGPTVAGKFSPVNIHEVTEHVAKLVLAETNGKLLIRKDYDPSIPDLTGDREQLIQAVLNLVRNSMQALDSANMIGDNTGNRGEIILRTRIINHFTIGKHNHRAVCRLDIIDNGPGVPADIADRIFYPMISGRAKGSGLGLPIAQSAINRHHGLIECESHAGETIFSVFLPLQLPSNKEFVV